MLRDPTFSSPGPWIGPLYAHMRGPKTAATLVLDPAYGTSAQNELPSFARSVSGDAV